MTPTKFKFLKTSEYNTNLYLKLCLYELIQEYRKGIKVSSSDDILACDLCNAHEDYLNQMLSSSIEYLIAVKVLKDKYSAKNLTLPEVILYNRKEHKKTIKYILSLLKKHNYTFKNTPQKRATIPIPYLDELITLD